MKIFNGSKEPKAFTTSKGPRVVMPGDERELVVVGLTNDKRTALESEGFRFDDGKQSSLPLEGKASAKK